MNQINNFLKNNQAKLKKGIILLVIIIVVIVVLSLVIKLIKGSNIGYEQLENKLVNATKNYLVDFPNNKPQINSSVTIEADDLIANEYIKELKKYTNDSCSASVLVTNKDNILDYQAYLNCRNFQTKTLKSVLDNNKTLSSTGEGIYTLGNYNVYRGQNPNNYIKFANMLWRIVKYNDEEIQIIIDNENTELREFFKSLEYDGVWDDRYNTESEYNKGINNFSLSIALENIKKIYDDNFNDYNKFLKTFNLCVASRSEDSMMNGQECNSLITLEYIGLLPVYDYMNASLSSLCSRTISPECQNYNYLNNGKDSWWTLTANSKNTSDVYYVNYNGVVDSDYANSTKLYRFVLALKGNTLFKSGTGSLTDPYVIR